jgi:hypothetical protein
VFSFGKQGKYKNDVLRLLYILLYFYPRGRNKLLKDYPGILDTIKSHSKEGTPPSRAATLIAASILGNLVESLTVEQRSLILNQLQQLDFDKFKQTFLEISQGRSTDLPEYALGTTMIAGALVIARAELDNQQLDQSSYDMLLSEVFGALKGKSYEQRSKDRITEVLDTILPGPEMREGDTGPLLSAQPSPTELPPLSGIDVKVRLVPTATGIALFRVDDGSQITERRTLSQQDLLKIPPDLGTYRFVNLRSRSGEIYSCIIAGEDVQIFGNMRAFWWSLALVNVRNTDMFASMTRMTETALAYVCAAARSMWDSAIREARSIDNMRDMIVPLRNVHFEVISEAKKNEPKEAARLGLDIALAMILAIQSEDPKLEAFAYKRFKRFLWQPGEEPIEFLEHETIT